MPANLADAMVRLLEDTANEGLAQAREILSRGDNVLGNVWTDQLPSASSKIIDAINTVLPGLEGQFRPATYAEEAQFPRLIDPDLLEGHTVKFHNPARLVTVECTVVQTYRTKQKVAKPTADPKHKKGVKRVDSCNHQHPNVVERRKNIS
jgi:hypothetical protein